MRWVTKEQYIRYFMACHSQLYPDSGMTDKEKRAALEVRSISRKWCLYE